MVRPSETRAEQMRRVGSMVLYWAGFEDDNGDPLGADEDVERFIDALGNSSVPEAAATIKESL